MISISSNLNLMIKAAEKASKSVIRDFGEVEKLNLMMKIMYQDLAIGLVGICHQRESSFGQMEIAEFMKD